MIERLFFVAGNSYQPVGVSLCFAFTEFIFDWSGTSGQSGLFL